MRNNIYSTIYWTHLSHEDWKIIVAATSNGLCYAGSQNMRKNFTIPFDFHGTTFQLDVWKALSEIPYGQTRSYSEIANQIQKPRAVRAVGSAIGANPILITVPCHRVIGKNGALTGYRGGMEMKTKLLKLEHNNALISGDLHYA